MRINKCWFCSANIYPGHGVTFVRNDCAVFNFCRSKCHKLFKKRLNPRKIKWTKIHRKIANKELSDDPILQFEKRNNIPLIYDKNTMINVLESIPKIQEIKLRRENLFIKNRILSRQEESKERDLKFIEKYKRLLSSEIKENITESKNVIEKKVKKREENMEFN